MNRRTFLGRCVAGGLGLELGFRRASGATSGPLAYVASYPTPTLTDTWPKPPKTAKINFGKHTKLSYCPSNGLIYTCGGDGQGQHFGGNDSGTMDTVGAYDVGTHTYREDFQYRGKAGEPCPRGLDFIAFTWSPTLKEFWLGPGYAWDAGTKLYPWLDLSWHHGHFASYNPATRKFTDRGPRPAGCYDEGFGGSWDTKRDRLVWVAGQYFCTLGPATKDLAKAEIKVSSHRIETADTWYDADTDELYFVQLPTGKVYGYNIGRNALRLVADTGVTADNAASFAVVYLSDSKHCLIVYSQAVGGAQPWKLVDLKSGTVQHFNLFAPGCTNYNTGTYHPPSKTIVLTGGSNDGNFSNGGAFHHYRSNIANAA